MVLSFSDIKKQCLINGKLKRKHKDKIVLVLKTDT
jgi:hypothetical protein